MKAEATTITITIPTGGANITTLTKGGKDAGTKLELPVEGAKLLFEELKKLFGKTETIFVDRIVDRYPPLTAPNGPSYPPFPPYQKIWCQNPQAETSATQPQQQ